MQRKRAGKPALFFAQERERECGIHCKNFGLANVPPVFDIAVFRQFGRDHLRIHMVWLAIAHHRTNISHLRAGQPDREFVFHDCSRTMDHWQAQSSHRSARLCHFDQIWSMGSRHEFVDARAHRLDRLAGLDARRFPFRHGAASSALLRTLPLRVYIGGTNRYLDFA